MSVVLLQAGLRGQLRDLSISKDGVSYPRAPLHCVITLMILKLIIKIHVSELPVLQLEPLPLVLSPPLSTKSLALSRPLQVRPYRRWREPLS